MNVAIKFQHPTESDFDKVAFTHDVNTAAKSIAMGAVLIEIDFEKGRKEKQIKVTYWTTMCPKRKGRILSDKKRKKVVTELLAIINNNVSGDYSFQVNEYPEAGTFKIPSEYLDESTLPYFNDLKNRLKSKDNPFKGLAVRKYDDLK